MKQFYLGDQICYSAERVSLAALTNPSPPFSLHPAFFYLPSLSHQGKQQIPGPESCPLFGRLFLVLTAHRFVRGPDCPSAISPLPKHK